jgi:hypothetical protein
VRPRWGWHGWKEELLIKMMQDEHLPTGQRRKALKSLVLHSKAEFAEELLIKEGLAAEASSNV